MKQLYYTACLEGKSVSGRSGYGVRAASEGVSAQEQQSAQRYVDYKLPEGMSPETSPREAPVRLALVDTPELGRILVHSTHLGKDPVTKRTGNYFTHLVLLGKPPALDPMRAVRSFGNGFWKWNYEDGPVELGPADLKRIGEGGRLNDKELGTFLQSSGKKELLRFLLRAVLTTPEGTRVFIAAPPDDVAMCVYGLLRVLPRGLQEGLTFSTAETDPFACPARVVGVRPPVGPDQDMPPACYAGGCAGFNPLTDRRSELPGDPELAGTLLGLLEKRQFQEIDDILATVEALGVPDVGSMELALRLHSRNCPLGRQDAEAALPIPALARLVAASQSNRNQIVLWAARDPVFSRAHLRHLVDACGREDREQLARVALEEGLNYLKAKPTRLDQARHVLETVLPALPPLPGGVWRTLAGMRELPGSVDLEARLYLLPKLLGEQDADLGRWLRAGNPKALGQILALRIDECFKSRAAELYLEDSPPDAAAAVLARQGEQFLLGLVGRLDEDHGGKLFEAALPKLDPQRLFEKLCARPNPYPLKARDAWLCKLLEAAPDAGVRWAEARGQDLLGDLPDGRCVPLLAEFALEGCGATPAPRLLDFFESVSNSGVVKRLSDDARRRLDDFVLLEQFLDQPGQTPEELLARITRLADALERCADKDRRERVVRKLGDDLWNVRSREALEAALRHLGPLFGDAGELYGMIAACYEKKPASSAGDAKAMADLLAVGFAEGILDEDLSKMRDASNKVYPQAKRVAQVLRKKAPVVLEKVRHDYVSKWSKQGRDMFGDVLDAGPKGAEVRIGPFYLGCSNTVFFLTFLVMTIAIVLMLSS
jgi:hypothetical protein